MGLDRWQLVCLQGYIRTRNGVRMRKRQEERRPNSVALALLTCAICLTLPAVACSRADAEHERNRSDDRAPVSVVTARVVTRTMPITIPAVGTAEAINRVDIHAQVTGQLREILFTPGTDV